MSDPVTWGLLASAVIGGGTAAYNADQQKDAARDARQEQARTAKLSQSQSGTNVNPNAYKRRRPGAGPGFESAAMLTPSAGGGLLGS
jgi:hypothetical protein